MREMLYVHFDLGLPRTAFFFLKNLSCAGEATKSSSKKSTFTMFTLTTIFKF